MAFSDLIDIELYLKCLSSGQTAVQAATMIAGLDVDPDDLQQAIDYLSANNLELIAHVHMDDELREMILQKSPNSDPKCFDVPLGDGFKWIVVAALLLYKDELLDELAKGN